MKKLFYTLALTGLLTYASTVSAEFYAGIGLGGSFNGGSAVTDGSYSKYKNSAIYSLSGGYELPLPLFDLRGELEYLRTKPTVKSGEDRKLDALMANVYGNIPLIPLIDPYIGLGLGRARYDHSNSFAFQWMLGADYEVPFAPITIGGEYRYFKVNEKTGKNHSPSKFHTNILMLKARYLF